MQTLQPYVVIMLFTSKGFAYKQKIQKRQLKNTLLFEQISNFMGNDCEAKFRL